MSADKNNLTISSSEILPPNIYLESPLFLKNPEKVGGPTGGLRIVTYDNPVTPDFKSFSFAHCTVDSGINELVSTTCYLAKRCGHSTPLT